MDFKLPTFSAVVFGTIGLFLSFYIKNQLAIIDIIRGVVDNLALSGIGGVVLFYSNPIVGLLTGILGGFCVGLILEWIFSRKYKK